MKPIPIDKINKEDLKKAGEKMLEFSLNFDTVLNQCDLDVDETIEIMDILYPMKE